MFTKIIRYFPLLFLTIMVGCSGLPEHDVKRANNIPVTIGSLKAQVVAKEKSFSDLKKTGDWAFLSTYAEREKLSKHFILASAEIAKAEDVYQKQVVPLVKRNDPKEAGKLNSYLIQIRKILKVARTEFTVPNTRTAFLLKARKEAPQWVSTAKTELLEANKIISKVNEYCNKAMTDYSDKKEDISGRFAGIRKLGDDAGAAFLISKSELKKVSSGKADYAKLGDSTNLVTSKLKDLQKQEPMLKAKLDELYRDYQKKVIDRRIEYYVQVSRASWCEGEYCGEGDSRPYNPSLVTEEVFNFYDSFAGDNIAEERGFFGTSLKTLVPQNMWNALKINKDWNRDSSNNYADFYIEKAFTKQFQKYAIIENGKSTDTDWEAVPEGVYWANDGGDLGQVIASKPYGMYESETLTSAIPPGMDRVAKPVIHPNGTVSGQNKYGKWASNGSGGHFWMPFAGAFAGNVAADMLFGGNRYSVADYNGYNSWNSSGRKGGYYGNDERFGTYGATTYRSGSRYGNTHFAKRNQGVINSTRNNTTSGRSGSRAQSTSVRGAGSASRGRGPSGGGK